VTVAAAQVFATSNGEFLVGVGFAERWFVNRTISAWNVTQYFVRVAVDARTGTIASKQRSLFLQYATAASLPYHGAYSVLPAPLYAADELCVPQHATYNASSATYQTPITLETWACTPVGTRVTPQYSPMTMNVTLNLCRALPQSTSCYSFESGGEQVVNTDFVGNDVVYRGDDLGFSTDW
jgi:hypothetical protein